MKSYTYRVWDTKHEAFIDHICISQDGTLLLDGGDDRFIPSMEPDRYIVEFAIDRLDKHARLIYDGDIIYHDDIHHWPRTIRKITAKKLATYPKEPLVVEWNENVVGYDPFASEDDEQGPSFRYSPEKIEVVGNIHENQKLLDILKPPVKIKKEA